MKKLLCSFLMICALALPVAATDIPDLNQSGSIHITMQYDGDPVPGGELTLYRVGDIREEDGNYSFVLTEDFAASGAALENVQSSETARILSDYALRKGTAGEKQIISGEGKISFTDLQPGLYLLVQRKAAQGYHKLNPFLVSIPMHSADGYTYRVDASPKVSPVPANPEQPATGQSGWPIWVFISSGAMLAALLCFKKRA